MVKTHGGSSHSGQRSRVLLILLVAFALLVSACTTGTGDSTSTVADSTEGESPGGDTTATDPGAEPPEGGDIVMAIPQDLTSLDPMNGQLVTMGVIFGNVSEGLVAMDGETSVLQPTLAESWELIDDTTWRFKLREGIQFHNGEPFNAEAVRFSLERMQDEELGFQHAGEFAKVTGLTVIDDYTVEFTTDGPVPELPRSLVFLMILPPEFTQSDPEAIVGNPVGTGPYVFQSGDESTATFVANSDYWGAAPGLSSVTLLSRPDDSSRIAALQAGEVDIAWSLPIERADDVPKTISAPTLENNALILNGAAGATVDERVRRAVFLAIDIEAIRESVLGDEYSSPAHCQWYPPGVFGFSPDLENPGFDPDEARRLIQEAGAEGAIFRISVPVGRIPGGELFAQAIEPYLEDVGLDVEIQIKDYQAWIQDDVLGPEGGPHPIEALFAGINSFTGSASRPLNTIVRDGARVARFPHDEYPEIQPLLDEALATLDDSERDAKFQELGAEVCESAAFTFLYNYDTIWGTQEGIEWKPRFDERIMFDTITTS